MTRVRRTYRGVPIIYTRRARFRGAGIFGYLFVGLVVVSAFLAFWYITVPAVLVILIAAVIHRL